MLRPATADDAEAFHAVAAAGFETYRSFAASHWGTGAATATLAAVVAHAREAGLSEARLYTPTGQARARRFYAREGWTEVGEPFLVEALGLDLVELRRRL